MRIAYKIILVGAIPILIAAGIAVAAWLLLTEADRARNAAVLGGSVYRNLALAVTERDAYVRASRFERARHSERFADLAGRARRDLDELALIATAPGQHTTTEAVRSALDRYSASMADFVRVTRRNDMLAADMDDRATALIKLTDAARGRQHTSNTEILASLAERDRKLRLTREIVGLTQDVRAAVGSIELTRLGDGADYNTADWRQRSALLVADLKRITTHLEERLRSDGQAAPADELAHLAGDYRAAMSVPGEQSRVAADLTAWSEKALKISTSEQRAVHEQLAQLLSYSVQAAETEQATQNIAISTLKLGQQTAEVLAERDPDAAEKLIDQSTRLGTIIAEQPISSLIQTEMIDAMDQWRAAFVRAVEGLRAQNSMIVQMDASAAAMSEGARALNDLFTQFAESIGNTVRRILVIGAACGLLLGAGTALYVAKSITRPLKRLQHRMLDLAAAPLAAPIADAQRGDELGDMARAANFFVTEIGRREVDLRHAKDLADAALSDLRDTQASLIQAEKLASLAGLVAGVAHEINTPIGIALTTATAVEDEVRRFTTTAESGRLLRSDLQRFLDRLKEGSQLLTVNLSRAVDLVQSFKHVSADQASGEQRSFDLRVWLDELMTSLGPVLRKSGHTLKIDCRAGIVVETYPGALAQVLTNLMVNAVAHAFHEREAGTITVRAAVTRKGWLRLVFEDDGRGIAAADLPRVFEPFFTTGRGRGSTGLGLHIVYNLVTGTLHGSIAIESEPGSGTRFILNLPLKIDAGSAAPALAHHNMEA
jgi:signal transduction histidine kinase